MKKLLILIFVVGLFSCENQENDFPDYDFTTGYFPYQYPVRTLVLGDYIYDNSNDNNHKFMVSATMGGVYENRETRTFKFVVDESLCTNAFFEDGSPIRPLPQEYYELSDDEEIVIEPGSITGGIEVQLTEAFFNDPRAIRNTYVLPMRLTGVINLDTLLQGQSVSGSADPRITEDWVTLPKHFTMFGIKFVNPYHGNYLYFGKSNVSENSSVVENTAYSNQFIERNPIEDLITTGRTQVEFTTNFKSSMLEGDFTMILDFESDNFEAAEGVNCTIRQSENTPFIITGSGKYMRQTEEWGNKKRDAIYLSYTVDDEVQTYTATDTLVMRDRGIVLETYTPSVVIP